MASKIQIGTTLDEAGWIELNEYLNSEKIPNETNLECIKMAKKIKDGKFI